jgi:hypothetical protein
VGTINKTQGKKMNEKHNDQEQSQRTKLTVTSVSPKDATSIGFRIDVDEAVKLATAIVDCVRYGGGKVHIFTRCRQDGKYDMYVQPKGRPDDEHRAKKKPKKAIDLADLTELG